MSFCWKRIIQVHVFRSNPRVRETHLIGAIVCSGPKGFIFKVTETTQLCSFITSCSFSRSSTITWWARGQLHGPQSRPRALPRGPEGPRRRCGGETFRMILRLSDNRDFSYDSVNFVPKNNLSPTICPYIFWCCLFFYRLGNLFRTI